MHRERVSENVYWFQSEVYAQVTAGAVTGPNWAVMIDTLALPEEALEMRAYIEETVGVPVRYVINTHYHADHSWGNCFFPGATVIAHSLAREAMLAKGEVSLDALRKQNAIYKQVKLVPPHLTFSDGNLTLRVGKKTLVLSAGVLVTTNYSDTSPLIDVGDSADADSWVDQTDVTATTAAWYPGKLGGDADYMDAGGKYYSSANQIKVTIAGTNTAGAARIVLHCIDMGDWA